MQKGVYMNKYVVSFIGGLVGGPILGIILLNVLGLNDFIPEGTTDSAVFGIFIVITTIFIFILTSLGSEKKVLTPESTPADELVKFAKLLADGVITQEEFDKKKQEVL